MSRLSILVLWCTLIVISAYYAATHINLETNILKLLPKYDSEITSNIIDKASAKINDKLIITVASSSKKQARESFNKAIKNLNASQLFKQVKSEIDSNVYQQLYQQLHKYRYFLLAEPDRAILNNRKIDAYEYFIDMAKSQLYGPTGFSQQQLKTDPLFFFNNVINQLSAFNKMQIQNDDGLFYSEHNGKHNYFAFIQLKGSSYSPKYQTNVAKIIESSKSLVLKEASDFYAFGSILYVHSAYLQAKGEISTVGLGSLIGILLLFLLTFRSLLPLIVSVLTIGFGLLMAFAVTSLVFNKVHLFALVFGSTIAGVSIDYCFHYLCENALRPSKNTIKHILPGLIIGFSSSAMVYAGFVITGYSVLAQISLFSIVGLLAVLLNVVIVFPRIISVKPLKNSHLILKIAKKILGNPLSYLFNSLTKILVFFVIIFAMTLLLLQPNDDVRALQSLSVELKADENYIREVMSLKANSRYVLIHANTINDLLEKEAQFLLQLKAQNKPITGISDLISTLSIQNEIQSFYDSIYHSDGFKEYINNIGLDPSIITYQHKHTFDLSQIDNKLFENPVIKNMFTQRWIGKVKDSFALIVPLNDDAKITVDENIVIVQQTKDASKLFADFRVKSEFIVIIAALVLILLLAFIRYGLKKSLHLVLIPLSAGLLSLLLTQALGFHISLFSILALLLVLGMGLDYVVFLIEAKNPTHVTFALLLSSITTILSFGLLSLSNVAVIKSFGLTVALGILFILFLSPAIINKREK